MKMPRFIQEVGAAFQFLTRLPLPQFTYAPDVLSHSAKYFPVVGLAIGLITAFSFEWLSFHLPITIAALFAVLISVLAAGGLHEDGLADAADAFGGGWTRDQVLTILKDSRIGSYGALAIATSILMRTLLLAALAQTDATKYIVSAHVLSRWTILPLGFLMSSAREDAGQGARLARQISILSLCIGTAIMLVIVGYLLGVKGLAPVLAGLCVTASSGLYYQHRIRGITGDCFGTTTQLTEIAVYVAAVWHG